MKDFLRKFSTSRGLYCTGSAFTSTLTVLALFTFPLPALDGSILSARVVIGVLLLCALLDLRDFTLSKVTLFGVVSSSILLLLWSWLSLLSILEMKDAFDLLPLTCVYVYFWGLVNGLILYDRYKTQS